MYNAFSEDYDRFVDWDARLAAEMPFIQEQLQEVDARRVLDAACGTGMHTIALAKRDYEMVGADFAPGMIEKARSNAALANTDARAEFAVAGLGALEPLASPPFDAILCLGNSLPHIVDPAELEHVLYDFHVSLRPGGLLLVQNRNFDAVMRDRSRWMGPQSHREEEREWLFVRFYDFEPDGTITFNMVTLYREGAKDWEQTVTSTRLRPLREEMLVDALREAGFGKMDLYGNMEGAAFDRTDSPNLVIAARKSA